MACLRTATARRGAIAHSSTSRSIFMANHSLSSGRLATVTALVALALAGAGANAASASASADTACGEAAADATSSPAQERCKGTPATAGASGRGTYSYRTLDYP